MKKLFGLFLLALALLPGGAEAASRFWVGGTGTWDNSNTANWSATSGGASGASAPLSTDDVTFDSASGGGVVTTNATLSINSLTFNTFTGTLTFATNNNNITINVSSGGSGFVATGSGTRTLNMGNGTWTMAGNDALFNLNGATNLTLNANSSTLSFTGNSNRNFAPCGGYTFNTVSFSASGTGNTAKAIIGCAVTIGTLNVAAPNYVTFQAFQTTTISTMNLTGSTSTATTLFTSSDNQNTANVAITNNFTPSWSGFRALAFSGGTHVASNSLQFLTTVSGITISPPSGGGGGGRIIGG